jgi:hypothetical protein
MWKGNAEPHLRMARLLCLGNEPLIAPLEIRRRICSRWVEQSDVCLQLDDTGAPGIQVGERKHVE